MRENEEGGGDTPSTDGVRRGALTITAAVDVGEANSACSSRRQKKGRAVVAVEGALGPGPARASPQVGFCLMFFTVRPGSPTPRSVDD